jgi:hypothetical protein
MPVRSGFDSWPKEREGNKPRNRNRSKTMHFSDEIGERRKGDFAEGIPGVLNEASLLLK